MIKRMYVKDAPGKMPVEEMRVLFETAVKQTEKLRESCPLATWNINGVFQYYRNDDTDALWLGFALGLRCAERLTKAA